MGVRGPPPPSPQQLCHPVHTWDILKLSPEGQRAGGNGISRLHPRSSGGTSALLTEPSSASRVGPGQGLRPRCPWAPLPGHPICNPPYPRLHPASSGVCSSGVPARLVLAVRTSLGDPRWIRSHELLGSLVTTGHGRGRGTGSAVVGSLRRLWALEAFSTPAPEPGPWAPGL